MVWVWIGRILLGLLLLLAVLLLIPLKIQVEIGLEEQRATLRYLFLRFPVYPFKGAEEAEQAEEDEVRAAKGKGKKKGKGGKKTPLSQQLGLVMDILRSTLSGLRFLTRHIHLRRFDLWLRVGDDEPHETAVLYGQVGGIVHACLGLVANTFDCRFDRVQVEPNFSEPEFFLDLSFQIVALPIILLITAGIVAVKLLQNRSVKAPDKPGAKEDKGGAHK